MTYDEYRDNILGRLGDFHRLHSDVDLFAAVVFMADAYGADPEDLARDFPELFERLQSIAQSLSEEARRKDENEFEAVCHWWDFARGYKQLSQFKP